MTTRDRRDLPLQNGIPTVTGSDLPRDQPVTDASYLLGWINYAGEVARSNPDVYPLLQNYPALRSQARGLLDAAHNGECIDTLTELARTLDSNLYRIRNAAQPVTTDKFTNGRAKDRFNRTSAQARTTAPVPKERTMRATAAAPVVSKPAVRSRRIDQESVLDQLEHEWTLLRQEAPDDHEVALRAYFHVSVIVALHWINSDPYSWEAPEAFHGERLWKLCLWLRNLQSASPEALKEARTQQLQKLRGPVWDNYLTVCLPDPDDVPDNTSMLEQEVLPFTWDGIDSLWQSDSYLADLPADRRPEYLPKFANSASEDWHLCCLAVLFLNRACKFALADLTLYPTGDGR